MLIRIASLREYGWRGNAAKEENGGGARHPWHSPKFIFLAQHRPAPAETEGHGRTCCLRANRCATTAEGMGWGRRISQIGHPCRSAVLALSPLCPRSLPRETDCIQTRGATAVEELECRNPTTGMARCSARAASGHAAAAPPSSVMKLRLVTRSPRRQPREACW